MVYPPPPLGGDSFIFNCCNTVKNTAPFYIYSSTPSGVSVSCALMEFATISVPTPRARGSARTRSTRSIQTTALGEGE